MTAWRCLALAFSPSKTFPTPLVIPAKREAREPGPIAPPECWERWVPALAALGRDDSREIAQRYKGEESSRRQFLAGERRDLNLDRIVASEAIDRDRYSPAQGEDH